MSEFALYGSVQTPVQQQGDQNAWQMRLRKAVKTRNNPKASDLDRARELEIDPRRPLDTVFLLGGQDNGLARLLGVAPLSAAVYGSLGGVLGYVSVVLRKGN